MQNLGVTIGDQGFDHLVYHFVLTYSNWESVTACFSESFESLSEGFQNAVRKLGGIHQRHRTDRMSLAVNNASSEKEFPGRYTGLLGYYGVAMEKIQLEEPNENGDVEQSHRRFKEAVDEALRTLLASDQAVSPAAVEELVGKAEEIPAATEVTVEATDLLGFNDLFLHKEVWDGFQGECEGSPDGLLAGTALADVSGVF